VFGGSWQYVAPAAWVAAPKDFITVVVAEEPVLVVRGQDNVLRAFSNVCRHRATPLACVERGNAGVFRCPYHGWTYGLDGALKAAPEFDGVEDFERGDIRLPQLEVREVGPFLFVCLQPDVPFFDPALVEKMDGFANGVRHFARRTYDVSANWKVYIDNYLDGGYHVPHLHPGLNGVLDYANYRTDTFDGWNVQHSPMRAVDGLRGAGRVDDVRGGSKAEYFWVFPNFMMNAYDGVLEINRVVPRGVDGCSVIFDYWFAETSDEAFVARSIEVSELVQDEDRDICASVQRGLHSRFYDRGRYSVRRENGEHQFHQLAGAHLAKPGYVLTFR